MDMKSLGIIIKEPKWGRIRKKAVMEESETYGLNEVELKS
jgi:hypothetical protein